MITDIYIGDDKIDLFDDESIDVVSSVLDITDITKNTGDYSKTFTVPASKNNNRIFKHYYDANIDNTFDARIRVEGRIELGGIPFKFGKWRLSKVAVEKNKPRDYTINFFGRLPSLKDIVGKDLLSDLDLSQYDHDYNSDVVKDGLINGLFDDDIIYNLFAKKQYYYNSDTSDGTQTDSLSNIAFNGSTGNNGVIWNDLRASIKLLSVIEAIENKYDGLEFTRNFFGTTEFNELYMWLNSSKDENAGGETRVVDWNGGGSVWMNQVTDTGAYPVTQGDLSSSRYFRIFCDITPDSGFINQEYSVIIEVDGQEFQRVDGLVGNQRVTTDLNPNIEGTTTYSVRWLILTDSRFDYNASIIQTRRNGFGQTLQQDTTTATLQSNDSTFVISEEIPNLKIIDFLKGLFNMFKLVIIPMDDGVYYVDTVTSFYETGTTYDITKYIDFSKYNVERGVILNEIDLKFKDPETLLASEFKKNNNRGYGDLKEILKDNDGELLDGDSLTFELPFEQIVYEKLTDIFNDNPTNVQYGAIIDSDSQPTNPAAHIFYSQNILIRTTPISFIESSGNKIPLSNLNTPFHHYGVSEPNYATVFTPEFSTFTGVAITNNLYTRHYRDYINTIFNVKKRTFNYEAYLPIRIITKLNLNDTLFIKGNYYRIDKYNYNLLTGKTVLNLINNF